MAFWIVHSRFVTCKVCCDCFVKQDDRVSKRLRGPGHGIWTHLFKTISSTELDIQLRSSYMVLACQVSRHFIVNESHIVLLFCSTTPEALDVRVHFDLQRELRLVRALRGIGVRTRTVQALLVCVLVSGPDDLGSLMVD